MVKTLATAFVIFLLCTFGTAHAALIPTGVDLVYDSVQNITWYDPAPAPMTWGDANAWAGGLMVDGTTAGSWSLPTSPTTFSPSFAGQMGILDQELGNTLGGTLASAAPFTNIVLGAYWSVTEFAPGTAAWIFYFFNDNASVDAESASHYALAVHAGEVGAPVPIPASALLFGPGLAGLAAIRKRLKK